MERKILHGMRLEKPQNPTWNEAETQKFPTWNEAPGIQTSSDVVFPWWFLECRREFGGFVYSIHVSAKFGINLGKDSMLEWRNGFSFSVPVPYSDGSCGIGIVQVQRCSNSSIQIFQTSSLSSWSPFSRKKTSQKMGKNREKKSQMENCHCGILPWRGNVWEWWRRGVGHKIGNKSWVYSCCWIPFGILDSLRSLGSSLGFLNS